MNPYIDSMLALPAFTHAPEVNRVYQCDALTLLRAMDSESVNCIVTSPPYFGLRDYGADNQIGLEPTPREYVEALRTVFAEARRVLRKDGTLWLNLGDTYTGGGRGNNPPLGAREWKQGTNAGSVIETRTDVDGLPSKSLLGVPWRVAFALQDDGWILRSDIIWAKPNPMPESVTDRPTKAHEYVFMFAKSERYWYDADAIKEPARDWGERDRSNGKYTSGDIPIKGGAHKGLKGTPKQDDLGKRTYTGFNGRYQPLELRNKRSVWTVPTHGTPEAHFATFPEKLIEPMILAGCPAGGVVLDPFFGSGTTARVARRLNRNWIGCDVNPEYVALANRLLDKPYTPNMFEVLAEAVI